MLRKVKTPKILKYLATTEFLFNPILYYLSFRVISYYQPVVMLILPKQDLYDGKSQDFVLINQWITIKLVNASTPLPDLQVTVKKRKYIEMIIYEPHRNQKIETSAKNYAIQEQENENYFQDHNNLSSSYSLEQQCKLIDDDDDYCDDDIIHRRNPKLNSWYFPYDPSKGLKETIEHTLHIIFTTHTCGEFVKDLAIAYAVDMLSPYCNNKDIVHQNAEILIKYYKKYYQLIPDILFDDDVNLGLIYQRLIQDIASSLSKTRSAGEFSQTEICNSKVKPDTLVNLGNDNI